MARLPVASTKQVGRIRLPGRNPPYIVFMLAFFAMTALSLSGCLVGPNYHRPCAPVPAIYKEAPKGWKFAEPRDETCRGPWWKVFKDPDLDKLEAMIDVNNENVKAAEAQFRQALDLVAQARAGYFPTVTATAGASRQQFSANGNSSASVGNNINGINTTPSGTTISGSSANSSNSSNSSNSRRSSAAITNTHPTFNNFFVELAAMWEPDLWGSIRRMVEGAKAGAQASAAQLAATRLSMQGSLAQFYFQLRTADLDQKLLDETVKAYKQNLKLTQLRYKGGVVSLVDVAQAESQLKTAQAQAADNVINRQQLEHAIAVLIGRPPACFTLPARIVPLNPPCIPISIPSTLLERRPDVANAERLMAQANAQIGVAVAAFFPTLTLSATYGYSASRLSQLFNPLSKFWSIAGSLADTVFDAGLRYAKLLQARAAYDQSVAIYRQTLLAAFQDVEDNLVALRQLDIELAHQKVAVAAAREALRLTLKQYKQGTVAYLNVIIEETTAYTAEKSANDIAGRRMVAAAGLIKALGGGWDPMPMWNACM